MVFDGAAYYNLPTSSQATSSTSSFQHQQHQFPAARGSFSYGHEARGGRGRGRGRGSGTAGGPTARSAYPGASTVPNPAGLPLNPMMQNYGYALHQQQQPFMQHQQHMPSSLPARPQMGYPAAPAHAQYQNPQLQSTFYPPQHHHQQVPQYQQQYAYPAYQNGQMYNAQGYAMSPTAYAQPPQQAYYQQPQQLPPTPAVQPYIPPSIDAIVPQTSFQRAFCEACNMRFKDDIHRIAHQRNEHVRCCKADEGCKFEGMPAAVEIHEQDRHLIFRPGAKPEVTKPDGPLDSTILGTTVRLETEEDIQKWIEERKRKWPGSKNTEILKEREAKRRAYDESSPANLAAAASAARGDRGRGRGRGGSQARGGINGHSEARSTAIERDVSRNMIWRADGQPSRKADDVAPQQEPQADTLPETSSASQAEDEAQSDDEEDAALIAATLVNKEAVRPPSVAIASADRDRAEERNVSPDLDSGDEDDSDAAPEEERIERVNGDDLLDGSSHRSDADGDHESSAQRDAVVDAALLSQKPCRDWIQTGQCRFGAHCRYSHDPLRKGKKRPAPPKPAQNPFDRDDMIGKLLYNEVRHEISDLVQVIDFLARNRWLENVELYPGHKQEVENRIKVVASKETA